MEFNLTIQEAIEAMENDCIICIPAIHPHVHYKIDCDKLYSKNTYNGTEWKEHVHPYGYVRFSSNLIKSKWSIYEELKENKVGLWYKEELCFYIDIKSAIKLEGGHHAVLSELIPFEFETEKSHWFKALETFMQLKGHPLAIIATDNEDQWFIAFEDDSGDLAIDSGRDILYKFHIISPMFSSEKDANKAMDDIGQENIVHMMMTFQGIYE